MRMVFPDRTTECLARYTGNLEMETAGLCGGRCRIRHERLVKEGRLAANGLTLCLKMKVPVILCLFSAVGCDVAEKDSGDPVTFISDESRGESNPVSLKVRFEPDDWSLRVINESESAVMLGEDFFGVTVRSKTGEDLAGGARGVLAVYENYKFVASGDEAKYVIQEPLRIPGSVYDCTIHYIESLAERPKTFSVKFPVND